MALQLGVSAAARYTHKHTLTHTLTVQHVDNAHTHTQLQLQLMVRRVRVVRQILGVARVVLLSVQPGEGLPTLTHAHTHMLMHVYVDGKC